VKYYNYHPIQKTYENFEEEEEKDRLIEIDPISKLWKLDDNGVYFGVKPLNKNIEYGNEEEIHLCYGERANSFLIVEYGFTVSENRYDFVRLR
jgi:hypothetical protein